MERHEVIVTVGRTDMPASEHGAQEARELGARLRAGNTTTPQVTEVGWLPERCAKGSVSG